MSTVPPDQASAASPERPGRWTSKRAVVLLGVLAAGLAAVSAAQPWGTGTATADVVGVRALTRTGGQLAPIVPGLALVGGAAAVAAATTGRLARMAAVAAMAAAGVATVAAVLWLLHDLAGALGDQAAQASASSRRVPMTATATAWPWAAALAGLLLVLASVLAAAGLRRWQTPSGRYERPGDAPARERSLWERVGAEEDLDGASGPDVTAGEGADPGARSAVRDAPDTRPRRSRPDTGGIS